MTKQNKKNKEKNGALIELVVWFPYHLKVCVNQRIETRVKNIYLFGWCLAYNDAFEGKEVAGEVDEVDDEVDNDDVDDEETVDEDDDADVHVTEVGAAPTRTALEGAELLDVEDEAAAIVTEDAAATDGDDVEDTDDTQMDEAAGMVDELANVHWPPPDAADNRLVLVLLLLLLLLLLDPEPVRSGNDPETEADTEAVGVADDAAVGAVGVDAAADNVMMVEFEAEVGVVFDLVDWWSSWWW